MTADPTDEKLPPTIYDIAGMLVEVVETQRAALRASQGDLAYYMNKSDLAEAEASRLADALRASRQREIDAAKGYPDDLSTVPPNERAKMLLANVRARGDEYGDVANSFGDLLRDALVLAAKQLNEWDDALRAKSTEVERLTAEVAELRCDPSAEYDAACDLRSHAD